MDNKPPYPSFRKDYPECRFKTKGEHSSSYFVRTGVCKTKINNKKYDKFTMLILTSRRGKNKNQHDK